MLYQQNAICKVRFFIIFSPFLSILVTFLSIGTVMVIYFSEFSPKQVNRFLKSVTAKINMLCEAPLDSSV